MIIPPDQLESMRDEWDALAAVARSPLFEHAWISTCARVFHDSTDLRIVGIRQGGQLAGIAPLAFDRVRKRLVLVGAQALYEPGGWLFSSDGALEELSRAVIRLGEPLALERISRESALRDTVIRCYRGQAVILTRNTAPSHVIHTGESWASYSSRMSSRTRRSFERCRTGLEREFGRVEISVRNPSPQEVDGLLDTFVKVEGGGWKGRVGSALSNRPELLRFFRSYCSRAAERGCLRVSTLSAGFTVAAMEIGIEAYGRMWGLKVAYEESLAAHAPGLQLIDASIHATFDRGLEAYEFLGSAESWQQRWRPSTRSYVLLAIYPLSMRGVVRAGADAVSLFSKFVH